MINFIERIVKLNKRISFNQMVFFCLYILFFNSSCNKEESYLFIIEKNDKVTHTQIDLFFQAKKCYPNTHSYERIHAIMNMLENKIEEHLARKLNIFPNEKEIEIFSKKVDAETKAPQILNCIKKVYLHNEDFYKYDYLAPFIVNNKIREFYYDHMEFHTERMEKAREIFEKWLLNPKIEIKIFSNDSLIQHNVIEAYHDNYYSNSIDKINYNLLFIKKTQVDSLKEGQLFPRILESKHGFHICKLLKKIDNKSDKLEIITILKVPFEEWRLKETQKLKIINQATNITKKIKQMYPEWWLNKIFEN